MAVPTQHNLSPESVFALLPLLRRGLSGCIRERTEKDVCPEKLQAPPELSPAMVETNVALISTLVLKGCCLRREMEMKQTQGI